MASFIVHDRQKWLLPSFIRGVFMPAVQLSQKTRYLRPCITQLVIKKKLIYSCSELISQEMASLHRFKFGCAETCVDVNARRRVCIH